MDGIIAWLAPILSTIIVTAATASINAKIASGERKRDEARAETDAKRAAEAKWRDEMDMKVDTIMGATQTTMRATLIHNFEKYAERGWLTPEERASWCDMHDKYSSMGFNGLIDTYRSKLDALPDKEI